MDWEKRSSAERIRRREPRPIPIGTKPPSPKQLRYLRTLAERTGQTFISPRTSVAASSEITRLKKLLK